MDLNSNNKVVNKSYPHINPWCNLSNIYLKNQPHTMYYDSLTSIVIEKMAS